MNDFTVLKCLTVLCVCLHTVVMETWHISEQLQEKAGGKGQRLVKGQDRGGLSACLVLLCLGKKAVLRDEVKFIVTVMKIWIEFSQ